ncbi:anthranilate synthase component I family protein [Cryobacterium sp. SO2]|uniref:anthranilate synthase component I family protein n=1 Tax=Cryobacterium sp. SO2 TaxID=1897060 RepID=UPI00223D3A06|nr:anthranilate synthase component I family protein [Cryobacterium sp. SO2]WEO79070.1 anthranilate synthase component I family protein [Cryobacterium sp. SO2]
MPSTPLPPSQAGPALRRFVLPRWIDPAVVFDELFAGSGYSIWLDAGAEATSGMSYLAGAHAGSRFVTASARAGTVTSSRPLSGADSPVTTTETVFDFLRAVAGPVTGAEDAGGIGFTLGWVGWLGYGLWPAATTDASAGSRSEPDAALLFIDRAIAFDHAARTVTLLARAAAGEAEDDVSAWLLDVSRRLDGVPDRGRPAPARPAPAHLSDAPPAAPPAAPPVVRWRHNAEHYAQLIHACQERIRAGDAYQLCLTNEVTVAGRFDPLEVYRQLRASSPSHHGGLLRFGAHALLSASPEEFLSVSPDGRLRTKPIKGTRPRSTDPALDGRLREELLASDKERAENLMIVDLMRNDLGRVAALGSVAVTALLQVESYPHVHQLVSTVEARLAAGLSAIDAVESCFPAGSMTGAPKASAMRILHALEGGDRGVYAGAFGYLGEDGNVDLAMVIRSIVLGPAGASIGTGGGITALSVAEEEIEETQVKARALIRAVLACSPAPDPAQGQDLVT